MTEYFPSRILLADFLLGSPDWLPMAIGALIVIALLTLWSYRRSMMSPGLKTVGVLLKTLGVALLAILIVTGFVLKETVFKKIAKNEKKK